MTCLDDKDSIANYILSPWKCDLVFMSARAGSRRWGSLAARTHHCRSHCTVTRECRARVPCPAPVAGRARWCSRDVTPRHTAARPRAREPGRASPAREPGCACPARARCARSPPARVPDPTSHCLPPALVCIPYRGKGGGGTEMSFPVLYVSVDFSSRRSLHPYKKMHIIVLRSTTHNTWRIYCFLFRLFILQLNIT